MVSRQARAPTLTGQSLEISKDGCWLAFAVRARVWWWPGGSWDGTTRRDSVDRLAATLIFAGWDRRSAKRRKVPLTTVEWVGSGGHLRPQEPGELPGDRGRHDGLDVLAGCQDPEPGAQALLGCPRPGNNLGFKALLAAGDLDAGAMLQGPGRPGPAGRAGAHCRPW